MRLERSNKKLSGINLIFERKYGNIHSTGTYRFDGLVLWKLQAVEWQPIYIKMVSSLNGLTFKTVYADGKKAVASVINTAKAVLEPRVAYA